MRYAVYFTPRQEDALTQSAAEWLGRDAFSGSELPPPSDMDRGVWQTLTAEPRRYGFHATLKAPFTLAEGKTQADLVSAFRTFCETTAASVIPSLALNQLGPFFALTPADDATAINSLCASVVERFELFRAPLSPQDLARRKPERLTENQRLLLHRWGYPYVFEEFRFHMTLTGPVPPDLDQEVRQRLLGRFARFIDRPLPIDHLALFCQKERDEPFHVLVSAPLL